MSWAIRSRRFRTGSSNVTDTVAPSFHVGDKVTVRAAYPIGHVRTPYYVRGKHGIIERLCGIFANAEELAYARPGLPKQPLYRVRFRQRDIWTDYSGSSADVIEVEIYQHWLAAEQA